MPRFVHIDHCLCHFGGHEYDYAVNVLQAAEAMGYEVALATNQRFRNESQIPARWPVYPVFPFTTYTKHCVWYGGHDHLPIGLDGESLPDPNRAGNGNSWATIAAAGLAKLASLPRRLERRRLIQGFARACRRLFEEIGVNDRDHLFFATITEFDMLGLARYLRDHPRARRAHWHLQFHFGLFGGLPPEASVRAERRRKVRRQFDVALAHLPSGHTGFYNTTEQLAVQYSQLNVGQFRYIPYPVTPKLQNRTTTAERLLRVTCAGAARRDKRTRDLIGITRQLRNDPYFDRKLELAAQLPTRKARRLGISPDAAQDDLADVPFLAVPHPLARSGYHELIGRTDIGLFLHDSRRYFAQCSGVLHEMLAAGKPVIVPGGCWLADQIAEPISDHIEGLCVTLATVDCAAGRDLPWWRLDPGPPARLPCDELSFAGAEMVQTQFSARPPATELVVGFRWSDRTAPRSYVRAQLVQFDDARQEVSRFKTVVGWRPAPGRSVAVFHLDPQTARFCLRLQNAHRDGPIVLDDVEVHFLNAAPNRVCPAGQVGLIAATTAQIPALLRDMVEHYPHYRESAASFSHTWCQTHHPARTVEILTGTNRRGQAAAA